MGVRFGMIVMMGVLVLVRMRMDDAVGVRVFVRVMDRGVFVTMFAGVFMHMAVHAAVGMLVRMFVAVRVAVFVRRRMFVKMRVRVRMRMDVRRAVGVGVRMLVLRAVVMVVMFAGVVMRMCMDGAVVVLVHVDMRRLMRMAVGAVVVAVRAAVGVNVPVRISGVLRRHRLPFDPGLAGAATTGRTHACLLDLRRTGAAAAHRPEWPSALWLSAEVAGIFYSTSSSLTRISVPPTGCMP